MIFLNTKQEKQCDDTPNPRCKHFLLLILVLCFIIDLSQRFENLKQKYLLSILNTGQVVNEETNEK
ncbi:hypothetical protein JCM14036_19570 [Desulfotomaculum defluvii]